MRLNVYEIEVKITVKVLKPFFLLKGARFGDVRRLARPTKSCSKKIYRLRKNYKFNSRS